MAWEPNDREITSVLNLEGAERYSYFVKRVADQQELWSLWGDGWVLTSDDSGRELIPVWPHSKYAALCAKGKWEGNVPKIIELEAWMERWVEGAKRDRRLVAVFPTPENRGIAVEPDRLAFDLELELANYE
jgi:hypothetical protein